MSGWVSVWVDLVWGSSAPLTLVDAERTKGEGGNPG